MSIEHKARNGWFDWSRLRLPKKRLVAPPPSPSTLSPFPSPGITIDLYHLLKYQPGITLKELTDIIADLGLRLDDVRLLKGRVEKNE